MGIKVGHGGTLDPIATGVLVIGVGTACRELGKFLNVRKCSRLRKGNLVVICYGGLNKVHMPTCIHTKLY